MKQPKLTMEEHIKLGRILRKIRDAQSEVLEIVSGKLPKKVVVDRLLAADYHIQELKSNLDSLMFSENWSDRRAVTNVYYGPPNVLRSKNKKESKTA